MRAVPAVVQNLLGVRTWDDVRNMVHSGAPAVSAALVGWNVVDSDKATLIAGLLVAMASPLAAYPHADNAFRKYLYGVIAAFQAVLIGVVGVVDSPILDLCGSAMAILGGMVASTNTPVSRDADYAYVAPKEVRSANTSVPVAAEQTHSLNTGGWRGL